MKPVKLKMWAARDENGTVELHTGEPYDEERGYFVCNNCCCTFSSQDCFCIKQTLGLAIGDCKPVTVTIEERE